MASSAGGGVGFVAGVAHCGSHLVSGAEDISGAVAIASTEEVRLFAVCGLIAGLETGDGQLDAVHGPVIHRVIERRDFIGWQAGCGPAHHLGVFVSAAELVQDAINGLLSERFLASDVAVYGALIDALGCECSVGLIRESAGGLVFGGQCREVETSSGHLGGSSGSISRRGASVRLRCGVLLLQLGVCSGHVLGGLELLGKPAWAFRGVIGRGLI